MVLLAYRHIFGSEPKDPELLKQEYELRKKERRILGREERERQQAFKREKKVLKAKQKHRGR